MENAIARDIVDSALKIHRTLGQAFSKVCTT